MVAMVCFDGYDDVFQLRGGVKFLEHAEYVLELRSDERMNLPFRWDRDVSGLAQVGVCSGSHNSG